MTSGPGGRGPSDVRVAHREGDYSPPLLSYGGQAGRRDVSQGRGYFGDVTMRRSGMTALPDGQTRKLHRSVFYSVCVNEPPKTDREWGIADFSYCLTNFSKISLCSQENDTP